MASGTIKTINQSRAFGFIKEDNGQDVFFHKTGVKADTNFDRLQVGDTVTFEKEKSSKGPRGIEVSAR